MAAKPRKNVKGATRRTVQKPERRAWSFGWVNSLLILTGSLVVVAAATKAYLAVQAIPVRHIDVTGELAHTQKETVQDMVAASLQGGFLKADLNLIRGQLEALPWIYEANVRRRWPNALEIHVEEQFPIARWGEDGFLNHEGGIFRSAQGDKWQDLPLLSGPEGAAPGLVVKYQRLVDLLAPLGLTVTRVAVDERGQVDVALAGGMQLALGASDFLQRMRRFTMVYRRELADRRDAIERVDLRYAHGLAVAFAEPPDEAGAAPEERTGQTGQQENSSRVAGL